MYTARAHTHTHKAEHALGGPAGGAPVAGGGGAVGGKLGARGGGGAARARHGGAGAVGAEAPGRALGRAGTEVARLGLRRDERTVILLLGELGEYGCMSLAWVRK